MSSLKFALAVADVRAGRSFPANYDEWGKGDDVWGYERGRMWARLTPRNVPLKVNGRVTEEAIRWYRRHVRDIL